MPCAISWLFRCIGEQKQKSGTRFSVRVSALEVTTTSYPIKDLLAHHATDKDQSPSIYLCEGGLQNWCELRAPNAERAAFYLDAALATRSQQHSHLFYTLHVYQYSVAGKGAGTSLHYYHFILTSHRSLSTKEAREVCSA
ncbi:hypothetical protein AAG570_003829 [Ranatra chinensis]|uniref:Kinesin motor domain-containing protein n=1 Tax=Ranatra chinensis TaxID=642074 RepID=A0ABD0Y3E0_9HEMI